MDLQEAWTLAVGVTIQKLRIGAGLTQEGLALASSLTRNHLQNIERGSSHATLAAIVRISEALGVRPVEVLEEAELLVCSPAKLRAAMHRREAVAFRGRPKKGAKAQG